MHSKQKEKMVKTFRYSWILMGIVLISAILISFIRIHIANGKGISVETIFFAAGLYALLIYLISTMIIILLKEIIKRLKHH